MDGGGGRASAVEEERDFYWRKWAGLKELNLVNLGS